MKRIKENWNAIEAVEEEVRRQTNDPEAGFNPTLYFLGGDRHLVLRLEYRKKNRNGFTKKRYEKLIQAQFCPFTGKPLYEESKEIAVRDGSRP